MPTPGPAAGYPADDVRAYADLFAGYGADRYPVTSPLGVWLLLALLAPAAAGPARDRLLGVVGDRAHDSAMRLLARQHAGLPVAVAAWADPGAVTDRFAAWDARMPAGLERGPVPSQSAADAWARDRTRGLIGQFPIRDIARYAIVLTSALAADVTWLAPYRTAPADLLAGPFADRATNCLTGYGDTAIHDTAAAGLVAAHTAAAHDGVTVVSVIADPAVPADRVQRAALGIAAARPAPHRVPLRDLPLGDGPAWTVVEQEMGSPEEHLAYLPAWAGSASLDDLAEAPGVADGLGTMASFLRRPGPGHAVQSATASYSRTGFAAAAVTAFAVRTAGMPRQVLGRAATVRFGHPYAVVAVLDDPGSDGGRSVGPWHRVPAFTAWVGAGMVREAAG